MRDEAIRTLSSIPPVRTFSPSCAKSSGFGTKPTIVRSISRGDGPGGLPMSNEWSSISLADRPVVLDDHNSRGVGGSLSRAGVPLCPGKPGSSGNGGKIFV